ncbi:MAG: hypothetical protein GF398_12725 [Chitinivibrionales bacterium]|nr:hypothetical protein [Chitinivibrionales bacterium]
MHKQNITPGQHIHGFEVVRIEDIPEVRCQAIEFAHVKTGARLVHLYNDDRNNLFSIAFRTPVFDDTGVPHILEHSVLCGSRKFPVKDPFQELLKGSLQTFLNALTYPDKTVYPVSSQVEKDFYNLVDVYCDAVFHPRLTEHTFAQEGWHFDVANMQEDIGIKGIVYNEMKGVFSDFSSHVSRKTMSALFPDTTYFYESGGDPAGITSLTWEGLRNFHAKFYHPSNAFVFTYGNLPSEKTLAFLDANYLREYDYVKVDSEIAPQPCWKSEREFEVEAPAPPENDGTATIAVCWLVGNSTDPVDTLMGRVLSRYLLGSQSSPLKRALIDSGLGEDLDDISGFDAEVIQGVFAAGLRKARPENKDAIVKLIFDTLRSQVNEGLDDELLEGCLRQIEFSLREIRSGGSFPYNLQLADRCYRSWLYGGDPLAHIRFENPLAYVKKQKEQGLDFFKDKLQALLIDNNHRLTAVIKASSAMAGKMEQQTQEHVGELTKDFDEERKKQYHSLTLKLLEEQKKPSDPGDIAKLPKLSKQDLPLKNPEVPLEQDTWAGAQVFLHKMFTAGIAYLDLGFDYHCIPEAYTPYLPIYAELLTRCGAAGLDYEQMAKRISLSTGGINSTLICETKALSHNDLLLMCFLHGKALDKRFDEMTSIFHDLLLQPVLDNKKQIKDILFEIRNDINASVIHGGHSFAMAHAASSLCRSRNLEEKIDGIDQLRFLNELLKTDTIDTVVHRLLELHKLIINRNTIVISITADDPSRYKQQVEELIKALPEYPLQSALPEFSPHPPAQRCGIEISAAVNYVARAWALDSVAPDDIGNSILLARNLSTGYLWDKVRVEGGAYGGMASSNSVHPVFICGSYRDPNLAKTLNAFESALAWEATGIPADAVDQSIIGTIGKLDAPKSPHGRGFGETVAYLSGRSKEFRQQVRDAILQATPATLKKKARELIDQKASSVAVLGSSVAFDAAEKEGITFKRGPLIPAAK